MASSLLRPAKAGHAWLLVAMAGQQLPVVGYGWPLVARGGQRVARPLPDKFRLLPCSVDLRLPSSQADSSCIAWRDALDGLTVVATLAHELFWTCDCLEDPRRCAADSRHQCPFICVGKFYLLD